MTKKQIAAIILAGSLILLGGVWFYYSRVLTVNYLIPGVPYFGIQNLFFQRAEVSTPAIASTMDILGYWGDKRFKVADLKEKFPINSTSTPSHSIRDFFEENGYEIYQGNPSLGNEIGEIKKFVNSRKKIPVIALQKRSLESEIAILTPRVVIGVFDSDKKVVVHDNFGGNNYEISYENFGKMFEPNTSAILAVWPSEKIKGFLREPNHDSLYPERTEIMDKLGHLLTSKASDVIFYRSSGDLEKVVTLYEEFINDPNFEYLPPAFRVSILSVFAHTYFNLKQYNEAIKVINERVLPLNKDFGKVPEGWFSTDEFSYPYYVLSLAYLKGGEMNLAISSYKEMKLIRASICEKISEGNCAPLPLIEELEKEISAKK